MKTVNAEKFNKHPSSVYEEACESEGVRINHLHYKNIIFVLTARKRRATKEEENKDV